MAGTPILILIGCDRSLLDWLKICREMGSWRLHSSTSPYEKFRILLRILIKIELVLRFGSAYPFGLAALSKLCGAHWVCVSCREYTTQLEPSSSGILAICFCSTLALYRLSMMCLWSVVSRSFTCRVLRYCHSCIGATLSVAVQLPAGLK